jgi:uncharacterized protein involved in type VI secretion and phage assembly
MNERDLYGGEPDDPSPRGGRIIHTRVLDNCDQAGLGRVMVQVPWLDGPVAASVATGAAGRGRGLYFIPQKDDQVLVLVKEHPDLTAYVIGSVWTSQDQPPRREPDAASRVQLIRTPSGHEIVFNDETGELVITAAGKQTVSLSKKGVKISNGADGNSAASLTMDQNGNVEISGSSITINATNDLKLAGNGVDLGSSAALAVHGTQVRINDPSDMASPSKLTEND